MSIELMKAARMLNEAALNIVESFSTEITSDDYDRWLDIIRAEAKDSGISLSKKQRFDELAFDLLDNDPKLDAAEDPEEIKIKVVNALWHRFHSQDASAKAEKAVARGQKKTGKEEDEESGSDATEVSNVGSKIVNKASAPKAKQLPKGVNSDPELTRVTNSIGRVIADAYEKGKNAADKAGKIKCPYEQGTTRATLWDRSFKRGVEASKLAAKATEDEEFAACGSAKKEGFLACALAHQESIDGEVEFVNQYDEDSAEAQAFLDGWTECEMTLAAMCGEVEDDDFDDEDDLDQERMRQAPDSFNRMTMEP